MIDAGVNDGDMIVIDRADRVKDGSIVVARLNDEFVVKQFRLIDGRPWLYPANEAYESVEVTEDTDFEIWGWRKSPTTTRSAPRRPRALSLERQTHTDVIRTNSFPERKAFATTCYSAAGILDISPFRIGGRKGIERLRESSLT
jgi:peptidase S24-like protein